MKKIDVLIVYEHISRELESAILLQKKLEKKGYTTAVCQVGWDEGPAHMLYSPKIVIVPWCYDDKEYDYYSKFKGSCRGNYIKLFNIHCEQLSNSNALELMIPSGKAKEVFHLVWGKYFEDILLKNGVSKETIYVTGSGRLDFFRKEYAGISKNKTFLSNNYLLDESKKWVLLIGNYNGGLLTNTGLEALEKKGYANIYELAELTQKTYASNLKWYENACSCHDITEKYEFIYRPHPSEVITDELLSLQKKYSSFHIIQEYAIRDWIVNADLAFSWNSTSAVEVAAANVPIMMLRPYELSSDMQIPLLEYVERITTQKDFITVLKEGFDSDINKEFKEHISYYYSLEGKAAVDKICELVEKEIDTEGNRVKGTLNIRFGLQKLLNYHIKMSLYKAHLYPKHSQYGVLLQNYASEEKKAQFIDSIEGII